MTQESNPPRAYHHGDLKAALLREAEVILEKDGIHALTLRATARAAGVSHAAPKNHFDDLTGLLSELAASGFHRFSAALLAELQAGEASPRERMKAMGRAYVAFARSHPNLFQLMFRSERLDASRPALKDAIESARHALRTAVSAREGANATPLQMAGRAAFVWSLVHGFSLLLLDGRLNGILNSLPENESVNTLLEAVLNTQTTE